MICLVVLWRAYQRGSVRHTRKFTIRTIEKRFKKKNCLHKKRKKQTKWLMKHGHKTHCVLGRSGHKERSTQLTLKKEKREEEGMKLELMLKRVQRYLSDSDKEKTARKERYSADVAKEKLS